MFDKYDSNCKYDVLFEPRKAISQSIIFDSSGVVEETSGGDGTLGIRNDWGKSLLGP